MKGIERDGGECGGRNKGMGGMEGKEREERKGRKGIDGK